jgi:hypothetical protein
LRNKEGDYTDFVITLIKIYLASLGSCPHETIRAKGL